MKPFLAFCSAVLLVSTAAGENAPAKFPKNAKEVTALLEKRWSPEAIQAICVPENRFPEGVQNLVLDGERSWRENLYEGKKLPYDKIFWYAAVSKDEFAYSLNVVKGKDHWLLEIGDEVTLHAARKRKIK